MAEYHDVYMYTIPVGTITQFGKKMYCDQIKNAMLHYVYFLQEIFWYELE